MDPQAGEEATAAAAGAGAVAAEPQVPLVDGADGAPVLPAPDAEELPALPPVHGEPPVAKMPLPLEDLIALTADPPQFIVADNEVLGNVAGVLDKFDPERPQLFQLYFESLDLTDPATLNSVGYILTSDGEATRHLRLAAACLLELLFEMLPPEFAELLFRHAVRMLADPDSDVAKAVAEICAQLTHNDLIDSRTAVLETLAQFGRYAQMREEEPSPHVEQAEISTLALIDLYMHLENDIQEVVAFCLSALECVDGDEERRPLHLLMRAVVDYFLVHPSSATIRVIAVRIFLHFCSVLVHEHFAERDAFEGIIDNATPKFRWLYAGVEDLEAPLLETSMAAFESYLHCTLPGKSRFGEPLLNAFAGLAIHGLRTGGQSKPILEPCIYFWHLSGEEAVSDEEHKGIFVEMLRKHLPVLAPLLVDVCRVGPDDPVLIEANESAHDPDSAATAKLDLQTFGIHEGCGVYATLQRHELAEFLPQVQESFGLGFHVLEDADEAAAELALDVRIADLFAGEEMGAIQQELLLQCEMDSDDEVIEQRAGTMNEAADLEDEATVTVRDLAGRALIFLADGAPDAMLPAILPKLNSNLAAVGEGAWREVDAAVLCFGAIAGECSELLADEIPGFMQFLVSNLSCPVPIVAQTSGWAISQLAFWVTAQAQVASGAFGAVMEQLLLLTKSEWKGLQTMAFDSISTLAESAGAAFEPFVLKLVKAVADGMRDDVYQDKSLSSGVQAIGFCLAQEELVPFLRDVSVSHAVVETLANAWSKAGAFGQRVYSAVPDAFDRLLRLKALAPEALFRLAPNLLGKLCSVIVECSEIDALRQEFRADEAGTRHRTMLLFAALQFLDTLCESFDRDSVPEALGAIPHIERLVPALLQILDAKSEFLSHTVCCLFGTLAEQGCHDLLLEPYADTILRVLPRHVRARVFGVASNAVWAFTELMQTVPRPIVEKRVGMMLAAVARIQTNGAAAPPDYQQNAEILHNLCGNAVFR